MVSDHLERVVGKVASVCFARRRADKILEQVNIVVGMHVLQYCCDALQPHASIHRWLGQRVQHTVLIAVVLHEYQVPDFNIAITIGLRTARRAAPNIRPMVVKNFRTGTTWTSVCHLPEIIGCIARAMIVTDTYNALDRHAHFIRPDVISLIILGVNCYPQLVSWQLINLSKQFPGIFDCTVFKIVPKAEITQHLEKCMMPRGITHILQVVVLTTRAYTPLRRRSAYIRTLIVAEEAVFELHHAGVGEQQCRIIARHQWTGRHDSVLFGGKIIQKFQTDFAAVHLFTNLKKSNYSYIS